MALHRTANLESASLTQREKLPVPGTCVQNAGYSILYSDTIVYVYSYAEFTYFFNFFSVLADSFYRFICKKDLLQGS